MDKQIKELKEQTAGSGVDVTETDGGQAILVNLPDGVTFDVGSSTLKPQFRETLDKVAPEPDRVSQQPDRRLRPHRFDRLDSFNQTLSENRARTVMNYLISQGRLGRAHPQPGLWRDDAGRHNDTADGRAKNRRVEIKIVPVTQEEVQAAARACWLTPTRSDYQRRARPKGRAFFGCGQFLRPPRQPLHRRRVDRRGGDQHAESARIALVVVERLAERVGHGGAGLARDQGGGADVPFDSPSAAWPPGRPRPAATIAMRSAIELGWWTWVRSASLLGRTCAGTRAPAVRALRLAASRFPLRQAPARPRHARIRPRAGASSMPSKRPRPAGADQRHRYRPAGRVRG
jgi:outer membrane protein OmpA-like peptidoglycan-associated protein